MKKILPFLILISIALTSFSQDVLYQRARIWLDGKPAKELAKTGIDLSEGQWFSGKSFVSDFSETEIAKVRGAGFRVEIIINDLKSYLREQNNITTPPARSRSVQCEPNTPQYSVPAHFHLGTMAGYYRYTELLDIIDSMALLYPNLITVRQPIDTTLTIEGRPIYYVKISDNPNTDEPEPEIMYDAVHHAREPESMTQLIYYMWYLLENYSTDSTIHKLVDNTEMYFVPCINPDGYLYNEFTNPGGYGFWRKNRRDNADSTFGVDLNRNYGYLWGYDSLGSSQYTGEETYRGTGPFSEPETRAVRNFINSRHFLFALNYHTYGNHLLYPWGYTEDTLTPDSTQYEYYGNELARYNRYDVGTSNQTLFYLVNGDADAWFYGEQISKPKIFAMTPEIGVLTEGFWPPASKIVEMSQDNMYPNIMLAKLAGRYGALSSDPSHYITQLTNNFEYNFQLVGMDTTGIYTVSIIPISSNIISVGGANAMTNLNSFQKIQDSISFTLSPTITEGDKISYAVVVNNGLYDEIDTVEQVYGSPVVILSDDGSTTSHWNASTNWSATNEEFYSPPMSITDLPFSVYFSFDYNFINSVAPLDLTTAVDARLTFYAKWNVEPENDYVAVSASTDNGQSWTPLCGKYTVTGGPNQSAGDPVYEGFQFDWLKEEMSLNDYLGQDILLQFLLVSDGGNEFDGFFFDDLNVEVVQHSTTEIGKPLASSMFLSAPVPNPSSENAIISYSNIKSSSEFFLYNSFGQLVLQKKLESGNGKIDLPVKNLSAGLYSYFIQSPDGEISASKKMLVRK